ncbi:MAG: hypothetical protein JST71_09940 [Bacteroidetes bacterium]|nr:hypothetical protein [Bacteroidota bacterium]
MKKSVLTLAVVAAAYCANAQTEKKTQEQPVKSEQATTPQKEVKQDAPATIQAAPAKHEAEPATHPADKAATKESPQKDAHKATEMEKPKDTPKQ